MVWLATRTLDAINGALAADDGNTYRRHLGRVLPHISDAYRDDETNYRTHLGASVIGGACERAIAYGWRWAYKRPPRGRKGEPGPVAHGRMIRLWNRGHLEEGRFIALMLSIGVQIYQQDAQGKQLRIYAHGGHFAGSSDGVALGIPDLPVGVPCLTEYKTHGDKSFKVLKEEGVKEAKREHYVQMQIYMGRMGLMYALYVAVNKNDDELYAEIIKYDGPTDAAYLERARRIIYEPALPARIRNGSPGFHVCKHLCDFPDVCFHTVLPDRNCRTCQHSYPMPDGTWQCTSPLVLDEATRAGWEDPVVLSKEAQIRGCEHYELDSALK